MKFNSKDFKEITSILRVISNHASKKILEIYNSSFDIKKKIDNSPITEADLESNKIICDALKKKFPKIPIISEENKINFNNEKIFFLVDPLDGTKEFINRNGEFTVNIALIINSISHLGVIEIPVKNIQYFSDGENSFKVDNKSLKKIDSFVKREKINVVVSRSHLDNFTENWLNNLKEEYSSLKVGSSIKFCMVAEGKADLYFRYGNTMEWDTAAGSAIIKTSNASMVDFNLENLNYGKKKFKNSSFIVFNENVNKDLIRLIVKK